MSWAKLFTQVLTLPAIAALKRPLSCCTRNQLATLGKRNGDLCVGSRFAEFQYRRGNPKIAGRWAKKVVVLVNGSFWNTLG